MVKPPRTMQPEAVDLAKAGRDKTKAFAEDSFHSYMARKIDRQRQQFGLVVPPPLLENERENVTRTSLTVPVDEKDTDALASEEIRAKRENKKRRGIPKFGITAVLKRLQRRHGRHSRKRRRTSETSSCSIDESSVSQEIASSQEAAEIPELGAGFSAANGIVRRSSLQSSVTKDTANEKHELSLSTSSTAISSSSLRVPSSSPTTKRCHRRTDLFFTGIVVLVNGYTDPDAETLQRLLHRHGGDLEKYETSRVTHIVAERLSHAKATMYAKRKQAPMICRPAWIVDSVRAERLLPVAPYLVIGNNGNGRSGTTKSVASFFQATEPSSSSTSGRCIEHNDRISSLSLADRSSGRKQPCLSVACSRTSLSEVPHLSQESCDNDQEHVDDREDIDHCCRELSRNEVGKCDDDDDGDDQSLDAVSRKIEAPEIESAEATEINDNDDPVTDLCLHRPKENEGRDADGLHSTAAHVQNQSHSSEGENRRPTTDPQKDRYINGRIRTVGTDPSFLESFFAASRLSFIGSYKQRAKQSPTKNDGSARTSSVLGERFVFHVDMDCFFASVVLRNFPQYRNKPVVISHHGENARGGIPSSRDIPKESSSECATCNYEARKYGIEKGMYLGRAKALCPDLIILQYDFEGYEEVSDAVADILERHATEHSGYVEHVSCDEAYIEFYLNAGDNGTGSESPSAVASELAETIRQEVFETTQCTATVGVGPNKFLAKVATDHVKPNRTFVVNDYRRLLAPLQLRDLHGVGYRLERKLAEEDLVSVQDVWDLGQHRGEQELCRILGPGLGKKIFGFCQGNDDRPVQPAERKTIGAECNYGVRFDGPYGVDHMMEGLCREVEHRMTTVGVKGLKITLKVKQRKEFAPPPPKFLGHGSCHNLSKSLNVVGGDGKPTRSWKCFFEVAMQLFAEMKVPKNDIRGMGIVVSKLTEDKGHGKEMAPHTKHSIASWFSRQQQCDNNDRTERFQKQKSVAFALPAEPIANDARIEGTDAFAVADSEYADENNSVVVDLSENAASSATTAGPSDCDFDIALPSLSQIHMSQVEELPSPMRRQIVSKMENAQASAAKEGVVIAVRPTEARASPQNHVFRVFRQTDVKRMLKLAALKYGEHDLVEGNAVSLTQLEDLPLELQLQVANDDQRKIGLLSPQKKRSNPARRKQPQPQLPQGNAERKERRQAPAKTTSDMSAQVIDLAAEPDDPSIPLAEEDPDDFYRDNILPLSKFLDAHTTTINVDSSNDDDNNDKPPADARRQVAEFLCQCAREHRCADVVVLLRSMRNRGDVWSRRSVLDSVVQTVNQQLEQEWCASLDWDWILRDSKRQK